MVDWPNFVHSLNKKYFQNNILILIIETIKRVGWKKNHRVIHQ